VLEKRTGDPIRVFAVWQPMLATDWSRPATAVLGRLSDSRVRQYWDPNHLVATRMEQDARPPQPEQECCVRSGILWDLAAVYPPGAIWSERMPPAILFNGPVADIASALGAALAPAARSTLFRPPTAVH
jgi:hypothetical protein